MRLRIFGFIAAAWMNAAAAQGYGPNWERCHGEDADVSIRNCTAIIDHAGHVPADDRADAYHAQGQLDKAFNDYAQARRLNRLDHDPAPELDSDEAYLISSQYVGAGDYLWKKGHCADAIVEFDYALKVDPRSGSDALIPRGVCQIEAGRMGLADEYLSRAVALGASTPNAIEPLRYRCFERAVADRLPEALDDCNAGLAIYAHDDELHGIRAFTYLKMKEFDLAIADYRTVSGWYSTTAQLLYGRGLAERAIGDRAGAARDIAAALRIEPGIVPKFERYGISVGPVRE